MEYDESLGRPSDWREQRQETRLKMLKKLNALSKEAYSGVTCREHDAIKTAIAVIKLTYDKEKLELSKLKGGDKDVKPK